MRIPGLSFLLRFLPLCLGLGITVGVVFLVVFVLYPAATRHLFDVGGQTIRDNIRWMLTPKNLIVLGPLLLMLCLVLAFLYFAQWL